MDHCQNNMSLACETEVGAQNEYALRFSITSKPVPVLEYIKAISSLVGAAHVIAVFEENESLKVYFDDKKYVDSLIKSGIHVMGHHIRIDYVVPPGIKVILTNVDPVITNYDIMRLLSTYGSVVSPIMRPPISDDTEYCHISYGVRYVYMVLNGGIPNRIEFKSGDQIFSVKARVEDRPGLYMIPYIKTDETEENFDEAFRNYEPLPGPSGINANSIEGPNPIVVSVESTASESSSSVQIESSRSLSVVSSKRKAGRPRKNMISRKNMIMKRKKVTPTSRAARRIRSKQKFMTAKQFKYYNRGKLSKKPHVTNTSTVLSLPSVPSSSDANELKKIDLTNCDDDDQRISFSGNGVLDKQRLEMYVEEVKGHRAPLELAKKYIGDGWHDNAINVLIEQLYEYKSNLTEIILKHRVYRLIKTLKESK